IIPATALRIAERLRDFDFAWDEITNSKTNIFYGAYYLRLLMDYYGKNSYLAIAAYNAGPAAVNRWLGGCKNCLTDEFVEAIPYRETRRYVKEVIHYIANYEQIYQRKTGLTELRPLPAAPPEKKLF